jgi:hypothetical protein
LIIISQLGGGNNYLLKDKLKLKHDHISLFKILDYTICFGLKVYFLYDMFDAGSFDKRLLEVSLMI